ncbi:glycosyl transferase family 2 [Desulfovibrio sp. X2]|uniref:glycosyltransferase n=1 Tax=Desulfovibrio sp. X2 TaxID=941449 RepID=UPI0003589C97|nr:glycosyltransferase [Desulfovibrio sp. X2]EPR43172.1 glycosyl transferase family 2 [Desulfovibrio sp. X2]
MSKDRSAEIFPNPRPDRRFLPNVPSKGASRRGDNQRYFADFDVSVREPGRGGRELAEGRVVDLSNTGMLVDVRHDLAPGDAVVLKFFLNAGTMPEGYESRVTIPARVVRLDQAAGLVAFQFEGDIASYMRKRRWRYMESLSLLLIFVVLLAIAFIKQESVFYFWFDVPVFLYGLCSVVFLLSRFLFAALYRSFPVDPDYTPTVSVIIPCFNEEEWIDKTIRSCLDQRYPEDKLEVVAVDDGSSDDSLGVLQRLKERIAPEVGDRFQVLALGENQGKRHALAAGARIAKGELLVFVDSDSFLRPDAVLNVVQPLKNPRIAAATGRCEVENKWTNFLTKMQAVRYFIGFRVFKAAESIFDVVTCLSGPLSCYRKTVVMEHLDAWIGQTFFGRPATFGDDRSLTNFLLKKSHAVYQHTAVCSTIVPSSYAKFYKQQMRWKRSWLREGLRAAGFMWRKEPFMALSFYAGLVLPVIAPVVVVRAFVFVPLVYHVFPYMYCLGILLMGMLMCCSYLLIKRSSLWIYGVPFCLFYLVVLLWQMIPATVTFWKSDWGTRPSKFDRVDGDGRTGPTAGQEPCAGKACGQEKG